MFCVSTTSPNQVYTRSVFVLVVATPYSEMQGQVVSALKPACPGQMGDGTRNLGKHPVQQTKKLISNPDGWPFVWHAGSHPFRRRKTLIKKPTSPLGWGWAGG